MDYMSLFFPNKHLRIIKQGRFAYLYGLGVEKCPHSDDAAIAWRKGWHRARAEALDTTATSHSRFEAMQ